MKKAVVILFVAIFIIFLFLFYKQEPEFFNRICKGSARCFYGKLEKITDGDTLQIDGETVRLALINTPEKLEQHYTDAIEFVERVCPVGSEVVVDEDDLQISRSHRRVIGAVYCRHEKLMNLNEELLKSGYAEIVKDFCESSEFAVEEWARFYGCA